MNIKGKWALVTGASSGIGEQFARQLAKEGGHLVLVARSKNKLENLASELRKKHGVKVEVIPTDLGKEGAPGELYRQCQLLNLEIEMLVNNAGFATHGLFEQMSGVRQHEEVMLNVAAVVDMTHLFLPDMLCRNSGAVINVASTAGFQPPSLYGRIRSNESLRLVVYPSLVVGEPQQWRPIFHALSRSDGHRLLQRRRRGRSRRR
ncbi:short-subunit dehydrogenase [Peribacillus simplex]|nr:short-subunit dehydrogenase [Peribacillus simplex]